VLDILAGLAVCGGLGVTRRVHLGVYGAQKGPLRHGARGGPDPPNRVYLDVAGENSVRSYMRAYKLDPRG
jgi:hypothetical protein